MLNSDYVNQPTVKYISAEDCRRLFPERPADCHKGNFGYTALIGGSIEYSGAIRLAAMANAAMRSGAGVATIAAPRLICPVIAPQILEATLIPLTDADGDLVFSEDDFGPITAKYDTIAFGMGIGNSAETLKAIEYLLKNYDKTLIVDADGLNAMSLLDHSIIRNSRARLILTPHLKEFSRLSGMSVADAKADPARAASYLADELDAVVLLKGSTTYVAGPSSGDSTVHSELGVLASDRGCPGMATAGSGDVLSGIISALAVNADDLVLATACGAYINGAAGELAESRRSAITMTSADTASCIAEVIESIIRES